MDFSWTEKELSCRELLKSHVDFQTKGTQTPTIIIFHIIHNYVKCIGFWPESIEVIEKKPKQKYKDRKYHQQERFDPVYIKEIRQKVTSTFYGNTLLLILFIPWSLFAHNCYGNAINAINIGLKDFMTLFALNFWLSIYLGKPQTELWPSKPINDLSKL